MKVKCYSVRLESLVSISDKAYKAVAFDGSSDIIPKSCVFGPDNEVQKCEAFWISVWILEKKSLQYSEKKSRWFDKDTHEQLPDYYVEVHRPIKQAPVSDNSIPDLEK
jgi:hypothetical protein